MSRFTTGLASPTGLPSGSPHQPLALNQHNVKEKKMLNEKTKNGSNGVHADAATLNEHDLLWDGLPPAVRQKLSEPLDAALVSERKGRGGRNYLYIEGHTVIDQANRIFGLGGWGFELVGDVTLREIDTVDAKTGEVRRIHAYSAPVRVTVPGAPPRTDIGFQVVAEENGEGHETAAKGAVTDGMKRALRSFGDAFGNGLYGDQSATGAPLKQVGGADALAPALRQALVDLGAAQGFDEGQVRAAVKAKMGKDLDAVSASELAPLVQGAARKLQQSTADEGKEAA